MCAYIFSLLGWDFLRLCDKIFLHTCTFRKFYISYISRQPGKIHLYKSDIIDPTKIIYFSVNGSEENCSSFGAPVVSLLFVRKVKKPSSTKMFQGKHDLAKLRTFKGLKVTSEKVNQGINQMMNIFSGIAN